MIYRFADLQFDTGRRLLTRNGQAINLTKLCFDVLKVLVEAGPDLVSHDELIDRVWGSDRVITPENLAQRIHLLRESIGDEAANPTYIEGVRGQGFRLIPLVEIEMPRPVTAHPPKRRYWLPALIGIAAVGILVVWTASQRNVVPLPQIDQKSVAVLPLKNIGGNPENEYLSDGITEALLNAIAQLPGLKVTARTSSFFFKGKDIDARVIAAQLGVTYLLEGSVQRVGNKLRAVAQLIEAETGYHLWSETYDRDMSDIFAVQDDIANSVARAMLVTLFGGNIKTVSTDNFAAYESYLKGMQQQNKESNTYLLLAETSFKKALALDPDFFEARLGLANTYLAQADTGEITFADALEKLVPLVDRLLEERPDDGRVLIPEIWVQWVRTEIQGEGSFDFDKHLSQLSAAIERTPNESGLYAAINRYLRFANRGKEAVEWADRGIAVDPLSWRLHRRRGNHLVRTGDLDGAEAAFARAVKLNPDNPTLLAWTSEVPWQRKQYAQWFAINRKAMDLGPLDAEFPATLSDRLNDFGLMGEADKYLQRARSIAPDNAVVRKARLARMLLHDHRQARDLSEAMLRDDIENRWGAYQWAATVFVSTMTELGETNTALAVLEELQPGVTLPDFEPQGNKQQALQFVAVLALAQTQSSEETLSLLDIIVPRWDRSFPGWRGASWAVAPIEMARGNTELAIELALKHLLDQNSLAEGDATYYRHLYYWKALALQPAVATRLAELDVERKKGGEDIWDYIVAHDLQL